MISQTQILVGHFEKKFRLQVKIMNKIKKKKVSLSIIIPALNEEKLIEASYREARNSTKGLLNYEIIFINDGSTDSTYEIMKQIARDDSSVRIINNVEPVGLGSAYLQGVHSAKHEFVVMVPGDLAFDSPNLIKLFSRIGEHDILIPFHVNANLVRPLFRRYISLCYTNIINYAANQKLPYYNSIVVHRTKSVRNLCVKACGFTYQAEILLNLLEGGSSYTIIDIDMIDRKAGGSKAFSAKNVLETLWFLVKLISKKVLLMLPFPEKR